MNPEQPPVITPQLVESETQRAVSFYLSAFTQQVVKEWFEQNADVTDAVRERIETYLNNLNWNVDQ